MLRYLLLLSLPMLVLSNTDAIIEYLQNFNHPGLGGIIDNLLQTIQQSPDDDTSSRSLTSDPTPPPKNYTFTAWSDYNWCDKICGGGTKQRKRKCVDQYGEEYSISKCMHSANMNTWDLINLVARRNKMEDVEEIACNTIECSVSAWSQTTSCTQKCGGGTITYTRECLDTPNQSLCNFQSKMLKPCNTNPCFRLGLWGPWSKCTMKCGGGRSSRSRKCEPNFPPFSPLYNELKYALDHVSKPKAISNVNTKDGAFYLSRYLASCGKRTVQVQPCNLEKCPECPRNQQWFDCRPCTKTCKAVNFLDLSSINLNLNLENTLGLSSGGCNGQCFPGCGCPPIAPLLGLDGGCYLMDVMCPQNRMNSMANGNFLLYQLLMRKINENEQTTTTTTMSPRRIVASTTTAPPETYTTTAYSQTPKVIYTVENTNTYSPTREFVPTTYPTTTMHQYKPYCVYNKLILDRSSCECKGGKKVEVECVASPGTKCPVICEKARGKCPSANMPRIKSTNECDTAQCSTDYDCEGGSRCCELLCGKRCVFPITQ